MSLAFKEIIHQDGIERSDVEVSLDYISNQLNVLDEKLKCRVDNEIWKLFQLEQQDILQVEKNIAELLKYK